MVGLRGPAEREASGFGAGEDPRGASALKVIGDEDEVTNWHKWDEERWKSMT